MLVFQPFILIIHILSATIIMGTAFTTVIAEIKQFTSPQVMLLHEVMWKFATKLLLVQLLTGIYLAGSEWNTIGKMPLFWIKMFLFFVMGGLVGHINRKRFALLKKHPNQRVNPTWSILGFLLFLIIATLGVLIAQTAA